MPCSISQFKEQAVLLPSHKLKENSVPGWARTTNLSVTLTLTAERANRLRHGDVCEQSILKRPYPALYPSKLAWYSES